MAWLSALLGSHCSTETPCPKLPTSGYFTGRLAIEEDRKPGSISDCSSGPSHRRQEKALLVFLLLAGCSGESLQALPEEATPGATEQWFNMANSPSFFRSCFPRRLDDDVMLELAIGYRQYRSKGCRRTGPISLRCTYETRFVHADILPEPAFEDDDTPWTDESIRLVYLPSTGWCSL